MSTDNINNANCNNSKSIAFASIPLSCEVKAVYRLPTRSKKSYGNESVEILGDIANYEILKMISDNN